MPASFQTVGLVGRSQQDGLEPVLDELLELLKARGATILVEDRLADISPEENLTRCSVEQIGEQADLVIVIGGDGSLLGAARTLARFDIPVLGVNRGRLGFLTDISPDELHTQVPQVLELQHRVPLGVGGPDADDQAQHNLAAQERVPRAVDPGDQLGDLVGATRRVLGELADLVGDDGEAATRLPGASRLDGCVQ